jgi:hypothetical protein
MRGAAMKRDSSPYRYAPASLARGLVTLFIWLCSPSCNGSEQTEFELNVLCLTDLDRPLHGVPVEVNGAVAGKTDRTGRLQVSVQGVEGDEIELAAICPRGFRETKQVRRVTLRGFDRLDGARPDGNRSDGDQPAAGPRVIWRCLPAERLAALVVRSDNQPDLPVMVNGGELARTGPRGTAHALLRLAPGSSLTVRLDTSDRPRLRPRNPQKSFQIEDRDTLLIFDQKFVEARPRRPRKKKSGQSRPHVPYRIR